MSVNYVVWKRSGLWHTASTSACVAYSSDTCSQPNPQRLRRRDRTRAMQGNAEQSLPWCLSHSWALLAFSVTLLPQMSEVPA